MPVAAAIASASCDQRRRRGELPAEQVHARPVDERDGKHRRARRPRAPVAPRGWRARGTPSSSQSSKTVIDVDDRAQQQPAHDRLVTVERLVGVRLEREPEQRHARGRALRAARRQPVEHEVDRARRLRRRAARRAASAPRARAESASRRPRVHRRAERLEIRLARQRGIERFEPPGGVEQQRRSVGAARAGRTRTARAGGRAGRSGARPAGTVSATASELQRGLRRSRLELGLRGGQRPPAALRRIGRQLGRALEERGRRGDAAAAARAAGRALELRRPRASSKRAAACARCQARRSGSSCGSVASASARWTSRRSGTLAARYAAERTSGCRKRTRAPMSIRPAASAGAGLVGRDARAAPRRAAAASRRRRARPPRAAAAAGSRPAAAPAGARSPARCG